MKDAKSFDIDALLSLRRLLGHEKGFDPNDTRNTFSARSVYLGKFADEVRPWFAAAGAPLPEEIRVHDTPPTDGRPGVLGATFSPQLERARADVAIAPWLRREIGEGPWDSGTLEIFMHELVHAALPAGAAHGPEFQRLAAKLGLVAPWVVSKASPELEDKLRAIAVKLGPMPLSASPAAVNAALWDQIVRKAALLDPPIGAPRTRGRLVDATA